MIPLLILAAFAYLAWKLWDDSARWIEWAVRDFEGRHLNAAGEYGEGAA